MKYTFETEINAPREKVAELAGNPANRIKWMQGLKSDEQVSGTPGQPGAKSRLVFQTGKVEIVMNGTVTARNLPDEFSETMDASNVFIAMTGRFVALSPEKTRYISEQDYNFKGVLNKIVGFLLQGEFKKQALTHIENFKRFAEIRENIAQVQLSDLAPNLDKRFELPENLPIPIDDGACHHLAGLHLPPVALMSTSGRAVDLASLPGWVVVYCYPRTGRPDIDPPQGWDEIPGARGCTPQACAFRDHYRELQALGAHVFGLSTQDTDYQREAVERLRLPFELLSDERLEFVRALRLPTFEIDGMTLIKRLTLIHRDGHIEKVFYPVFPPDKNVNEVISWLAQNVPRN